MKQELENIINNLAETYGGMPWHGNSLTELLSDVDVKMAFFRPFVGKHNIAELVAHILVWRQFALEMLDNNYTFKVDIGTLADFPKVTENEKVWRELLLLLDENQLALIEKLSQFNPAKLDMDIPQRNFSYRFLFDGVIHHDVYHGGQIGFIKAAYLASIPIEEDIIKKATFI
jgi:hypothetical protein